MNVKDKNELKQLFIRTAGNYLYCYIATEDLKYFPAIVARKREGQLRYIKAMATVVSGVNEADIYSWIEEGMASVYADVKNPKTGAYVTASPESALYYLAQGKPLAGKQQGAIGATTGLSFKGYELDATTGLVTNPATGSKLYPSPIYTEGKLSGATWLNQTGKEALTAQFTQGKGFTAQAVGNYDGQLLSPDGSSQKSQQALNVLQNINTMLPLITNIITSISGVVASFTQELSGVTPSQISVNQVNDGWVYPSGSDGLATAGMGTGVWLLAGALLGGIYLTGKDKKGARAYK